MLATPPEHPRRLVYLGTPELAVRPLVALHENGFEVTLVVTGRDKRRGRGSQLTPSPVKDVANMLSIPVSHDPNDAINAGAELGVVVAYGRLIKPPVLEVLPMINVHFSLLPRWRGAAPVERALLAGDEETGVCIMQLEEGLDTGPVYASARVPIDEHATLDSLRTELVARGTTLLIEQLQRGLRDAVAQSGEATYAAKLDPEELRLRWTEPPARLERVVRLGSAWTTFRGRRMKVLEAASRPDVVGVGTPGTLHVASAGQAGEARPGEAQLQVCTGGGVLQVLRVQPEGKPALDAVAWARGARLMRDERFV